MKRVIIGHRGVGKSALLNRLQTYLPDIGVIIDLDEKIAKDERMSILKIFEEKGEDYFRALEKKYFEQILNEEESFCIALGAGFQEEIPDDIQVLWYRRPSDRKGRIFADRPRLNHDLDPKKEYFEKYIQRERQYLERADNVLYMPDGFDEENEIEEAFFQEKQILEHAIVTLYPWHFLRQNRFYEYMQSRLKLGVARFEIRDDLLEEKDIKFALEKIPSQHLLLSFRKDPKNSIFWHRIKTDSQIRWDWAYELGPCPENADILSLHHSDVSFKSFVEQRACDYKLSVDIDNFNELITYHKWQVQSERYHFLPTSKDGRWSWYRRRYAKDLYFVQDVFASAPDQALLTESIGDRIVAPKIEHFAGVSGSPIHYSFSPAIQFEFSKEQQAPYFKIDIQREEWNTAISFLREIGLKFLNVSSPLKDLAYELADFQSKESEELKVANTLYFDHSIHAHNTDLNGFHNICGKVQNLKDIVIWGGGGTLSIIESILPQAVPYSIQTKEPRNEKSLTNPPTALIWASPNKHFETDDNLWPPSCWNIQTVVDLNYTEDSYGREYARKLGARYISGLEMLKAQAYHSQEYWKEHVR